VSPPGILLPFVGRPGSFPPTTMPSADFCHEVASPCGSVSPYWTSWQISQGEHASFRTCTPSLRLWPKMDRGLCLVLPRIAGSTSGWSHRCAPDSISVRHPVPSRHPAVAGRLPPQVPLPDTQLPYRYTLRLHRAGSKACQAVQPTDMLGSLLRCVPCPAHNQGIKGDGKMPPRLMPAVIILDEGNYGRKQIS
jgi:hypothetical protein